MNGINMSRYFQRTKTAYTPTELLLVDEWLNSNGGDSVESPLILQREGNVEIVFIVSHSNYLGGKTSLFIKTYVNSVQEGETVEISSKQMHFSNYNLGKIAGESTLHSFVGGGKLTRYHFGEGTYEESSSATCVYIANKRYGNFIENYGDPDRECIKGTYFAGQYNGTVKTYRKCDGKLGKLKKVENYLNGVLHGKTNLYYENGNIALECEYVFGQLYGQVKEYDTQGKNVSINFQVFDTVVTEKEFFEHSKKYGQYLKKINSLL